MILQVDAEGGGRVSEGAGEPPVALARGRLSPGVIMYNDERGGIEFKRAPQNHAWLSPDAGRGAVGNHLIADEPVSAVQIERAQPLGAAVTHRRDEIAPQIVAARCYLFIQEAVAQTVLQKTLMGFDNTGNRRRCGSGDCGRGRGQDTRQRAECFDQRSAGGFPLVAGGEKVLQDFRVAPPAIRRR